MSYDGGKGGAGVFQWIINQMPPHRRFVSLFLGNCAVMRNKRPAEISIGVEINQRVIDAYWRHTRGITIIHGDALEALDQGDWRGDDFIYADPPYLMETRSCQQQLYAFEFAEREQHRALLSRLKLLPCMVAISGYHSALYAELLDDWRTANFWTVNRAGTRAQEWLWMNYPRPFQLHDYRYLGRNFRERERIKRKKLRWTERLRQMPDLERYALLEAIQEAGRERSTIAENGEEAGAIDGSGDADDQVISPLPTIGASIVDTGDGISSPEPSMPAGIVENGGGSWPAPPGVAMIDQ